MPLDVGLLGADVVEDRLALVRRQPAEHLARVVADRHARVADRERDAGLGQVVERVDVASPAGTASTSLLVAKTTGFSTRPSL